LPSVEALLNSGGSDPRSLYEAACTDADPMEDLEGGVEFKRHLVGVLTKRIVADVAHGA
jgi:CO/xanthine dehydrogenase FAD-binding subunit